jgi:hypothetical protein
MRARDKPHFRLRAVHPLADEFDSIAILESWLIKWLPLVAAPTGNASAA